MITLTMDREDFVRLNNVLGHIASLGYLATEQLTVPDALRVVEQLIRFMPPDVARRLVDETDRQATAQAKGEGT